jgi:hypothetical protein
MEGEKSYQKWRPPRQPRSRRSAPKDRYFGANFRFCSRINQSRGQLHHFRSRGLQVAAAALDNGL